jgi:uncharacterized membrane protein
MTGSTIALTKNINQTIDYFGPLGHKVADVTGLGSLVTMFETEVGGFVSLFVFVFCFLFVFISFFVGGGICTVS